MPTNTVISYPVPAYSNPPIEPQFYIPQVFVITAITRGTTTLVTTSVDHDYVIGQLVRLLMPNGYGSRELNERLGYVIDIPSSTQVRLDIDSIGVSPFINAGLPTKAQIVGVGDINSGPVNASGIINQITYINGSFRNISPQ